MNDSALPAADDVFFRRIFLDARTFNGWLDRPVDEAMLRRIYDLARMGPTSANSHPARILFVKSKEAKERLRPTLSPTNVDKTMSAPVTAVVAMDTQFHERMKKLFPARPQMADSMKAMAEPGRASFLMQNTSLFAGYFMVAARGLGLDCGPMGGFDRPAVDAAFFADSPWRSTLLINLGYGDPKSLHPRNPRLDFDEACRIA